MIKGNIRRISDEVETICRGIGRSPGEITLVGITKFADAPHIEEAIAAGITHIGENKVRDAQKKFAAFENPHIKVTRHMVGHLQTNKVKPALEIFDCIQSVDSVKLAKAIEKQAAKEKKAVDILMQVNTAGEEQKFGIAPGEALALVEAIVTFRHVRLCGLMTIAPFTEDQEIIRKCFRGLRLLRDDVAKKFSQHSHIEMKYLSMGMTGDYRIALEEGSNMIRIGRAIFQD